MDYWDFHGAGMQGTVAGSSEHVKRMSDRPRVSLREICAFLRQLAGQRLDINIGAPRNNSEIISQCLALLKRVEGERKPAPVKRPRDGPSVACPDLRRFTCRRMPCPCVYIRLLPPTSGSHVEDLNCDLLLREFCAAFAT
jgi:hypothetical protein